MKNKCKVISFLLLLILACGTAFADYYSKGRVSVDVSYSDTAIRITNTSGQSLTDVKLVLNGKYTYRLGSLDDGSTKTIYFSKFGAPNYTSFRSLSVFCTQGSYTVTN